jgi:hypothetical protein
MVRHNKRVGCSEPFLQVKDDARFLVMIDLIKSQQDSNGFYTPEAFLQKLKWWDSGQ